MNSYKGPMIQDLGTQQHMYITAAETHSPEQAELEKHAHVIHDHV